MLWLKVRVYTVLLVLGLIEEQQEMWTEDSWPA